VGEWAEIVEEVFTTLRSSDLLEVKPRLAACLGMRGLGMFVVSCSRADKERDPVLESIKREMAPRRGLESTKFTFVRRCGKSLGHVQKNPNLTIVVNICRRAEQAV